MSSDETPKIEPVLIVKDAPPIAASAEPTKPEGEIRIEPKAEVPAIEAAAPEAPKLETPKIEAPKFEAPKLEAHGRRRIAREVVGGRQGWSQRRA